MDWTFDQYNRHWADISKHVADLMQKLNSNLGTVSKKKKLMEFSIKLAGWVLDAPVFH